MINKNILANKIYGENDAIIVLDFLEKVEPSKQEFKNETSFLNFIARKLEPMLKNRSRQSRNNNKKNNAEFWFNRATSMDIRYPINKAHNVLWCIQLLDGKCGAPED